MASYFITATDTDAGKTYVACALVTALVNDDKKVAVYKPISAGCEYEKGTLVNEDAKQLSIVANCSQSILQINPIAFEEPIAPHIAAQQTHTQISLQQISDGLIAVQNLNADVTIVEGAGGWRLPLGNGCYLSDFVKQNKLDVILVVNMKIGCLNHAVLTYQSIISDGLNCIAWVANCLTEMPYLTENINELKNLLPIPLTATLPFNENLAEAASKFDLNVFKTP